MRRAIVFAVCAACTPKHAADPIDAGASDAGGAPLAIIDAAPPPDASAKTASIALPPSPISDAGAPACKVLRGPIAQAFRGPAALRIVSRGEVDIAQLVFNDNGVPRTYDTLPGDAGAPVPPASEAKSSLPACALTRDVAFCPDVTGAIHRTHGAGEGDTIAARGRPGTNVVAAQLAGRAIVGYLAENVTTEGLVREAWVALDGSPPMRISEPGSGATYVDLAPRGDALVALTIDARVAMTPAHARILTLEAGKLHVSKDSVIFVGGSAERHNAGALTTAKDGTTFALIAVANDASSFGMAAVKIDDPPIDDAPVTWSLYPNGLDPAPIAASRGEASMQIARVRPASTDAKAPRALEIGALEPSGAFRARCVAAEGTFIKDVAMAADRQGALWVFYRDPSASRLVRISDR